MESLITFSQAWETPLPLPPPLTVLAIDDPPDAVLRKLVSALLVAAAAAPPPPTFKPASPRRAPPVPAAPVSNSLWCAACLTSRHAASVAPAPVVAAPPPSPGPPPPQAAAPTSSRSAFPPQLLMPWLTALIRSRLDVIEASVASPDAYRSVVERLDSGALSPPPVGILSAPMDATPASAADAYIAAAVRGAMTFRGHVVIAALRGSSASAINDRSDSRYFGNSAAAAHALSSLGVILQLGAALLRQPCLLFTPCGDNPAFVVSSLCAAAHDASVAHAPAELHASCRSPLVSAALHELLGAARKGDAATLPPAGGVHAGFAIALFEAVLGVRLSAAPSGGAPPTSAGELPPPLSSALLILSGPSKFALLQPLFSSAALARAQQGGLLLKLNVRRSCPLLDVSAALSRVKLRPGILHPSFLREQHGAAPLPPASLVPPLPRKDSTPAKRTGGFDIATPSKVRVSLEDESSLASPLVREEGEGHGPRLELLSRCGAAAIDSLGPWGSDVVTATPGSGGAHTLVLSCTEFAALSASMAQQGGVALLGGRVRAVVQVACPSDARAWEASIMRVSPHLTQGTMSKSQSGGGAGVVLWLDDDVPSVVFSQQQGADKVNVVRLQVAGAATPLLSWRADAGAHWIKQSLHHQVDDGSDESLTALGWLLATAPTLHGANLRPFCPSPALLALVLPHLAPEGISHNSVSSPVEGSVDGGGSRSSVQSKDSRSSLNERLKVMTTPLQWFLTAPGGGCHDPIAAIRSAGDADVSHMLVSDGLVAVRDILDASGTGGVILLDAKDVGVGDVINVKALVAAAAAAAEPPPASAAASPSLDAAATSSPASASPVSPASPSPSAQTTLQHVREAYMAHVIRSILGVESHEANALASGMRLGLGSYACALIAALGISATDWAEALAGGGDCHGSPAASPDLKATFRIVRDRDFMRAPDGPAFEDVVWAVLESWPPPLISAFLIFATGVPHLPPPRTEALRLVLPHTPLSARDHAALLMTLPTAHTCTRTLELPNYLAALRATATAAQCEARAAGGAWEAEGRDAWWRAACAVCDERLRVAVTEGGGYGLDEA